VGKFLKLGNRQLLERTNGPIGSWTLLLTGTHQGQPSDLSSSPDSRSTKATPKATSRKAAESTLRHEWTHFEESSMKKRTYIDKLLGDTEFLLEQWGS